MFLSNPCNTNSNRCPNPARSRVVRLRLAGTSRLPPESETPLSDLSADASYPHSP
jgi:hypothetical protein